MLQVLCEYAKEGSQKTLGYTEKRNCLFLCRYPDLLRLPSHQGVGIHEGVQW